MLRMRNRCWRREVEVQHGCGSGVFQARFSHGLGTAGTAKFVGHHLPVSVTFVLRATYRCDSGVVQIDFRHGRDSSVLQALFRRGSAAGRAQRVRTKRTRHSGGKQDVELCMRRDSSARRAAGVAQRVSGPARAQLALPVHVVALPRAAQVRRSSVVQAWFKGGSGAAQARFGDVARNAHPSKTSSASSVRTWFMRGSKMTMARFKCAWKSAEAQSMRATRSPSAVQAWMRRGSCVLQVLGMRWRACAAREKLKPSARCPVIQVRRATL
eukprot:9481265-Pyramimonas_sp.AAC.1